MHVTAIVLAAGHGLRLKSKIAKPLILINRKPIITYCLGVFCSHPDIKDIIVVANPNNAKGIIKNIKEYRIKKIKDVVLGGKLRSDSVKSGLRILDKKTDLVLIHDAARPFIDKDTVSKLIKKARKNGAVILGVPAKATIKKITGKLVVEKTIERGSLWEAQTPQVFRKEIILRAHERFADIAVTDDANLVEMLGKKVGLVKGSYLNIKITTPEDLVLAEAISKNLKLKGLGVCLLRRVCHTESA